MWTDTSRRSFLRHSGLGIGWLAAMDLFAQSEPREGPLAARTPPLPATAKSVIHLFMQGGPSQIDTFDPKPLLARLDGQRPPASFGDEDFQNGQFRNQTLMASKRTFRPHGQSGLMVSDLFPHVARRAGRHRRHPLELSRRIPPTRRLSSSSTTAGRGSDAPALDRGFSTGWARRTRTCPASSSCSRAACAPGQRSTGRGSCRPSTKARRSGPARTRSCT